MNMLDQRGAVSALTVGIASAVVAVALLIFGIWAFVNYLDQKNNVDSKVANSVASAKAAQKQEDEQAFAEREKQPTRTLVGPNDFGQVKLDYPKTWSVYIAEDGSGGSYEAYLHPSSVLPMSQKTHNAVLVSVDDRSYDETLKAFSDAVNKGELKASPITIKDQTGIKLEGTFSKDVKGAAVVFKLRDKTLKVMVQSNDYMGDFNNILVPSLQFNP